MSYGNYQGELVAASTKFILNVSSAAMAEALAMKDGLSLANSLGLDRIQAELDSTETIEACTGEEAWNASSTLFWQIVSTWRHLLEV
jgi:hypothetical protein